MGWPQTSPLVAGQDAMDALTIQLHRDLLRAFYLLPYGGISGHHSNLPPQPAEILRNVPRANGSYCPHWRKRVSQKQKLWTFEILVLVYFRIGPIRKHFGSHQ